MCSIFGILGSNQERAIDAFNTLSHRGEDGSKILKGNNYFFGSHRLAIESIGENQNQPLEDGDYIAIFNGEIYNYRDLINKYKLNASDEIETILELFVAKYNLNKLLKGMYAIAIYSKSSGRLWLYRDLVGKKPLYWTIHDNNFYFASEIKAINKITNFRLDKRALHHYLGYGTTVAPTTIQKDIYKVPPSSRLYFNGNSVELESSDGLLDLKIDIKTKIEAAAKLEVKLKSAVDLRIPKGIKWGVLLSGGLDSSLVAALSNRCTKERINLFSIGYEGYSNYDERIFAKEVSKHLDANFYSFNFTKDDFFNTLDEMLQVIDDPIGDPAQIPLYFLIKKAKEQGVKVLLSGDGSDELFLGYRTYKEYLMMERVKELPYANWLKNNLRSNFSQNKEWEWYKRALQKEVVFRSSAEIYTDRQLNLLLRLQAKDGTNFKPLSRYWKTFEDSNRDIIDWYSYCDLKVQLAEFFLTKIDRVSMANGVEVRSPFIDSEIVKLAFTIDSSIRFNPTSVKDIVKEVAKNYLPSTIITRKKKGLNYPFIEWILEEDGIDTIFKANKEFRIFKDEHLKYLSQKAKSGKFKQHLFPLYILSRWLLNSSS